MKITPLKAIKKHCLVFCSSGSHKEVRLCPIPNCELYIYRFGKNPSRQGIGRKSGIFAKKAQLNAEFSVKGDGSEGKPCSGDARQKMVGLQGDKLEIEGVMKDANLRCA